jgi:hypothetical protein
MLHTHLSETTVQGTLVRRKSSVLNVERLSTVTAVIEVWRGYTDCAYDKPSKARFVKTGESGWLYVRAILAGKFFFVHVSKARRSNQSAGHPVTWQIQQSSLVAQHV